MFSILALKYKMSVFMTCGKVMKVLLFCQWNLAVFETETYQFCSFISCSGSLVRPKVVRSVHYCPATKKTMERKYTDMTSLDAFPSNAIYPTKVACLFFLICQVSLITINGVRLIQPFLELHQFIVRKDI